MDQMILVIVALENELSGDSLPVGTRVIHCGVGKINAALATEAAINSQRPELVVNFGTAGSVHAGAHGLLEVARVIQRDMNAEPIAPRGVTPFATEPAVIESGHAGVVCATGDSFVTAADPWLVAQQVDVVDMELYAIAAACRRHGVAWRAFKFVTDAADESAAGDWSERVNHGEALFVSRLRQLSATPPGP